MDLHQLRVFHAAARAGGFTRAGEQLHLSQSTVSQHIQQLEQELGSPLFLRVGRSVLLSDAGKLLLQYAERLLRDLENAELAVREMSALRRGAVRLGVGNTTLTYRLPHILGEYNRRFPEIELIVRTGTTEFLIEDVKAHRVDLAIIISPDPQPGLALTPLGSEELVVVLHREHPLARKARLDPADLASLRFILFEKNTAMQDGIDRYFHELGIMPRVTMEVESCEAIKSLVRAGLGASILPLCAVEERSGDMCVLRVKNMLLKRDLALAAPDAAVLPNAVRALRATLLTGLAPKPRRGRARTAGASA